ncbi:hypothetical protein HPP92_003809 [Vanilla planifolia]|uniref:Uncharacterized protein n=1 Tax=Vanilla planifolia TaxID=51239 RepID=A0A835VJP8_VANPL|nr:hypothetical protein HPP92_004214 [Vanilla planifolia]KAG0503737.1 hypothetical protein HPP92_003809 [Vanilla planifolia]
MPSMHTSSIGASLPSDQHAPVRPRSSSPPGCASRSGCQTDQPGDPVLATAASSSSGSPPPTPSSAPACALAGRGSRHHPPALTRLPPVLTTSRAAVASPSVGESNYRLIGE